MREIVGTWGGGAVELTRIMGFVFMDGAGLNKDSMWCTQSVRWVNIARYVHILDGKNKMGRRLAGRLSFMVRFLSSPFESREFSVFGLAEFWPERRKG
jgi:hypothetical protein